MDNKLKRIEEEIEVCNNQSVEEQIRILEPLFYEAYVDIINQEIEIPLLLRLS